MINLTKQEMMKLIEDNVSSDFYSCLLDGVEDAAIAIQKKDDDNKAKDLNAEIRLLKQTVKALAKMTLHYRLGLPQLPEWVFKILDEAKDKYGDLTKII